MRCEGLPYPIGSVVKHEKEKCFYYVERVQSNLLGKKLTKMSHKYALIGSKNLGSEGMGTAWKDHNNLTLVSYPTIHSYLDMLKGKLLEEEGDFE